MQCVASKSSLLFAPLCSIECDDLAVVRLIVEKEERIMQLEIAVERAAEATVDKDRLLEVMQGDKTALSRAIAQNKELKNQLAELQNSFVKMVRTTLYAVLGTS